jgi:hypothetical protein
MKVTLHSTTALKSYDGVRCRVWEGTTEAGIACYALIPVIAHHKDDDARASEFRRDLEEHREPTKRPMQCFDIRNVL